MKYLLLFLLLVPQISAYSCHCSEFGTNVETAFDKYAYIAHVKIKKKSLLSLADSFLVKDIYWKENYRIVEIELLEIFKGKPKSKIIEWGIRTSCDMDIRENQEWILFGNYLDSSTVSISYCNTWFFLKNEHFERNWNYDLGAEALKKLRTLSGLPEEKTQEGTVLSYFPNGKIASEEVYKNGLLQGNRILYFDNGMIMEEGRFENGQPVQQHNYYEKSGQLIRENFFEKGERTKVVFWYDTSFMYRKLDAAFLGKPVVIPPPVIQKSSERWLNLKTGTTHTKTYLRNGTLRYELFSFSDGSFRKETNYYEEGGIKSESYYIKSENSGEEKIWNEKGQLISHKRWEKGNHIFERLPLLFKK